MTASANDTTTRRKRSATKQRPSASTLLLSEVIGTGLVSARQLSSTLSVPVPVLEAACVGNAVLPTLHQRGLALLVLEVGEEFPELCRLAHRLLAQTEAMLRMESGETECHSLAPVLWR